MAKSVSGNFKEDRFSKIYRSAKEFQVDSELFNLVIQYPLLKESLIDLFEFEKGDLVEVSNFSNEGELCVGTVIRKTSIEDETVFLGDDVKIYNYSVIVDGVIEELTSPLNLKKVI